MANKDSFIHSLIEWR